MKLVIPERQYSRDEVTTTIKTIRPGQNPCGIQISEIRIESYTELYELLTDEKARQWALEVLGCRFIPTRSER